MKPVKSPTQAFYPRSVARATGARQRCQPQTIRYARVRLLEVASNVVLRIDTAAHSYAMKVEVDDDCAEQHVDIALDWLAALGASDISVAKLVRNNLEPNRTRGLVTMRQR